MYYIVVSFGKMWKTILISIIKWVKFSSGCGFYKQVRLFNPGEGERNGLLESIGRCTTQITYSQLTIVATTYTYRLSSITSSVLLLETKMHENCALSPFFHHCHSSVSVVFPPSKSLYAQST